MERPGAFASGLFVCGGGGCGGLGCGGNYPRAVCDELFQLLPGWCGACHSDLGSGAESWRASSLSRRSLAYGRRGGRASIAR
jgi:hypothetical protein